MDRDLITYYMAVLGHPPSNPPPDPDRHKVMNGTLLTHNASVCEGERCCIHNPSDHSMKDFPQLWRGDRGLMERVCEHGVGHPDPDSIAYIERTRGPGAANTESVHGCDGCCKDSYREAKEAAAQ